MRNVKKALFLILLIVGSFFLLEDMYSGIAFIRPLRLVTGSWLIFVCIVKIWGEEIQGQK